MAEAEEELWEHCLARGRVVRDTWPGGSGGVASVALEGLVTTVMFHDVDPEFTEALIAFSRGLHAVVLAQRDQARERQRDRQAARMRPVVGEPMPAPEPEPEPVYSPDGSLDLTATLSLDQCAPGDASEGADETDEAGDGLAATRGRV